MKRAFFLIMILTLFGSIIAYAQFWPFQSQWARIPIQTTLYNPTNLPQTFTLRKGDLFETVNPDDNIQNIVLLEEEDTYTIPPGEYLTLNLKGWCTNQDKDSPAGSPVRVAPLFMNYRDFFRQEEVWNNLASRRR